MRIALVSFEFQASGAAGGIATYVRNAAQMLASRGHHVEVFHGDAADRVLDIGPRVKAVGIRSDRHDFRERVVEAFAVRHNDAPFQVVEGPEYYSDAASIRSCFPGVPLVVRLHTPTALIHKINNRYVTFTSKARFLLGGIAALRLPKPYWTTVDENANQELEHVNQADVVVAPCQAIIDELGPRWSPASGETRVVPNVFVSDGPAKPRDHVGKSRAVLYLGRLEVRKGVLELVAAAKRLFEIDPQFRLTLVGRSTPLPGTREEIASVVQRELAAYSGRYEVIPGVPYAEISNLIRKAAVVVIPSIWENFPYVCLEAMHEAATVVASRNGGMAEMIEHGRTGMLVDPTSVLQLSNAMLKCLDDPVWATHLGDAAQRDVIGRFGVDVVAPLQEAAYRRAVSIAAGRRS